MTETVVSNHCNALLVVHHSLTARGQEALHRLFLLDVKFLGNRCPPAARCKRHQLLTKHPRTGDDTSPGQDTSACSVQKTRTVWSLTSHPSAEQACPAFIPGSAQRPPAAGHRPESPRWVQSHPTGLSHPGDPPGRSSASGTSSTVGRGGLGGAKAWPVPALTCCFLPGNARFYPRPFQRALCGSRGA